MSNTASVVTLESGPERHDEPRWFGEPVCVSTGSPEDLRKLIPLFDRRPFSLQRRRDMNGGGPIPGPLPPNGENILNDLIVRLPLCKPEEETPVAIVSKRYKLVQHADLFDKASEAIKAASIDLEKVFVELTLSAYGSKMAVTFTLPEEFDFTPSDGHRLKLSFHCVNSVDGQCRLRIMLGWFRFICGNGLVVGTAQLSQKLIHNEYLDMPDLARILTLDLESAEAEKRSFAEWLKVTVDGNRLSRWVDGPIRKTWGSLAAARVYLICGTGYDGRFAKIGDQAPPHRKDMVQTSRVPGAPKKAENAYHIAQALAWISRGRRDIQDQLDGMMAIPKLMAFLLR